MDVTLENPAHLRHPIRTRTPQIVIGSCDPQVCDRADIGSQFAWRRTGRSNGVLTNGPGIDIRHPATLAAAPPKGQWRPMGPECRTPTGQSSNS